MQEYIINVARIEDLQDTGNTSELDAIFLKARKTIVSGEPVLLVRRKGDHSEQFDTLTTLEDLDEYKKRVYKYL